MVTITTPLNLLSYLACLLGTLPLYLWLDTPVKMVLPVALLYAIYSDRRRHYRVGPRLATALSFAVFCLYALQLNVNNVVSPIINLLTVLLCVRLITEKQGRNYLQIFVLSMFCLASSSLLSLNISFLPLLTLQIFTITIGLVLLTFYSHNPTLRLTRTQLVTILKTTSILPLVSLMLMLLFFAILPRTQDPLWDFLNPGASASSGFSEDVRPGSFASNATDKTLAFRAECPQLSSDQLYWRGTVLNQLAGSRWSRGQTPREKAELVSGQEIDCTIYLPAKQDQFLFTLDRPQHLEGIRHSASNDLVFTAKRPLTSRSTLNTVSRVGGALIQRHRVDRELYLAVPANLSPRLWEISNQLTRQKLNASETITRLKQIFIELDLSYATTDLPGTTAPIDQFLFEKKRGYCEFFASSFALLLRMADVPTRLVGGYHGGEYNNLGGYYRISQDMAHVWVEALVDSQWLRIDPSRLASNADSALLEPRRQRLSLLRRSLDGMDYLWTQAVLTYDLHKQFELIRSSGTNLKQLANPRQWDHPQLSPLLWLGVGGFILWRLGRYKKVSREQKILNRYLRAVKKKYALKEIPLNIGLTELARRLNDRCCDQFTAIYTAAIYTDRALSDDEYQQLQVLIKKLQNGSTASNETSQQD